MNPAHKRAAETAKRLIEKHGRNMFLRTVVKSGTPYNPTITQTDTLVNGVELEYSANEIGGPIQATDKKVLLSASVEPTAQMKLVDLGKELEIVNVKRVCPGEVAIYFELQIRK